MGVCIIVERPLNSSDGAASVVVNSGSKGQLVEHQQSVKVDWQVWTSLSLVVSDQLVSATVNGQAVSVTNCTDCLEFQSGYVALTSGWNMASFDDFSVVAPAPPKPLSNSWVQTVSVRCGFLLHVLVCPQLFIHL